MIAPSFADIFFNNSFKNGFLPIVLTELEVDHLFNETLAHPGYKLTIDLPAQTVTTPSGKAMQLRHRCHAQGEPAERAGRDRAHARHADEIKAYEEKRKRAEPWIFQ